MESQRKKNIKKYISFFVCLITIVFLIVTTFVKINYTKNELYNNFISKSIQNICAFVVALIFAWLLNIKMFSKAKLSVYLVPCLIIAINNMQWFALFSGKMEIIHSNFLDYLLFATYCITIGLFEEIIFRGILFTELLSMFPKNKKGLTSACLVSSAIFGLMHIFNGFSLSTLLQIVYSFLTGCLFVYCYVKTKNLIFPIVVHSIFNFCGMLFSTSGLGSGVVFDIGTIILMAVIDIILAVCLIVNFAKSEELFTMLTIMADKELL